MVGGEFEEGLVGNKQINYVLEGVPEYVFLGKVTKMRSQGITSGVQEEERILRVLGRSRFPHHLKN